MILAARFAKRAAFLFLKFNYNEFCMSKENFNFKNARNQEQIRRMKILKAAGLCYFCRKGDEEIVTTPKVIYESKYWFITPNNFPYEGSVHHYLIAPKRHIQDLSEIKFEEAGELFKKMIPWLKKKFNVSGYSIFARSGNMTFTGATINHLHLHFLVGGKKPKNATMENVVPVVIAYKTNKKNAPRPR